MSGEKGSTNDQCQTHLSQFCLHFPVSFRLARKPDLQHLEWDGLFAKDRKIMQAAFKKQQNGEMLMVVADAAGKRVGQVWLDLARYKGERAAYVWAMRVACALQGQGIGSRLLQEAESLAANRGFSTLRLVVDIQNSRARKLYRRAGFRTKGRIVEREPYKTSTGRSVLLRRPRFVMEKGLRLPPKRATKYKETCGN